MPRPVGRIDHRKFRQQRMDGGQTHAGAQTGLRGGSVHRIQRAQVRGPLEQHQRRFGVRPTLEDGIQRQLRQQYTGPEHARLNMAPRGLGAVYWPLLYRHGCKMIWWRSIRYLKIRCSGLFVTVLSCGLSLMLLGQPHGQGEHLVQRDAEGISEALHGFERWVPTSAFDAADIGPVQAGLKCQALLAQVRAFAKLTKGRANEGSNVHPDRVDTCGLSNHGL